MANREQILQGIGELSNPTLAYIEELMLTEDREEERSILQHRYPLALQAIESSFYQVISNKNHLPPDTRQQQILGTENPCVLSNCNHHYDSCIAISKPLLATNISGSLDFIRRACLENKGEPIFLCSEGVEEASKLLPGYRDPLNIKFAKSSYMQLSKKKMEEQVEISRLFDQLYLESAEGQADLSQPVDKHRAYSRTRRKLKHEGGHIMVLEHLLITCAQAICSDNWCTAVELLKQIREQSSPLGDGSQRCAHYFANAFQARLAGTGIRFGLSSGSDWGGAASLIKAYRSLISACPFRRVCFDFAQHHILSLAQNVKTLHIIDFGIMYGFRWIKVIKHLSMRPGGPPKIRISGVDSPQPTLWQANMSSSTGGRLAYYCERFGVPFEYNEIIANDWDKIRVEDLKIGQDEAIAVNCNLQFDNLLDEMDGVDCPRDGVLKLVRNISPHIFVHSIVNGQYSMPTFLSRFQEAFHHFSAFYDMHETIFTPENQERSILEKMYLGQAIVNVIACEGVERVQRPETYRRWQLRTARAGFRQLALDKKLTRTLRAILKADYHKDFLIVDEGNWLVQGWRGRNLIASCCWVPAP